MANKILEARQKAKFSQTFVAKKIGVTRQAISLYEKGEREPKLEIWKALADLFGVSVSYLQGESDYYSDAYDTAIEFRNYMDEEFSNGVKIKNAVNFYESASDYIGKLSSLYSKLSLIETENIYSILSNLYEELPIYDIKSISDNDNKIVSEFEFMLSLYFSRIQILKSVEGINNPSHIYTYTNWQLAKRDDASINEDDEYTIAYRNIYDLVYYLHLVRDNLSLVNLDKVDNAVNALKDLISSSDIVISDDLKKFINAYKSNQ